MQKSIEGKEESDLILNLSSNLDNYQDKQQSHLQDVSSSDKLFTHNQNRQQELRGQNYVIKPSDAGEFSMIGELSDQSQDEFQQEQLKKQITHEDSHEKSKKSSFSGKGTFQRQSQLYEVRSSKQQLAQISSLKKVATQDQNKKDNNLIDFDFNDEFNSNPEEKKDKNNNIIQQQSSQLQDSNPQVRPHKSSSFQLKMLNLEEIYESRENYNYEHLVIRQDKAREKKKEMKQKKLDSKFADKGQDTEELKEIRQQLDIVRSSLKYDPEHTQRFKKSNKSGKSIMAGNKKLNQQKVNIFTQVKKFISKMKKWSGLKEAKSLNPYILETIGDLSFSSLSNSYKYLNRKQSDKKQYAHNKIKQGKQLCDYLRGKEINDKCVSFLEKFRVIMPSSKWKMVWDVIVVCTLIMTLWMYPLDLIMGKDDMQFLYGWRWTLFNLYNLLIYVFDISSKFTTAYYEKAVCITDRRLILKNYLSGWFLYDIISTLPFIFELFQISYYFKFWNMLVFMKLPTFTRIIDNLNDMILTRKFLMNLLSLLRLIFLVIFVAHIFGILWLGQQELLRQHDVVDTTWIIEQGLEEKKWYVQYVWTFYFAITTMTTVGYGDITPSNEYEAGVLIIGMVVATGMFAYTFNSIGYIVDDLTRDSKEFKKQASLVNIYLNKKNTPSLLKLQIHKYLEYKFQSEKKLSTEEEQLVISKLPENMQEEIKFEQAMFIIQSNPHVFGKFSSKIQQRLAQKIKERKYHKHENIFQQSQISQDPCFYYIQSGKIEIYTHSYKGDKQFTILQKLSPGQSFGEQSFLTGQERHSGAQTSKPCMLSYLKRSDFLDVLTKSIPDFEVYCMNRDKILQKSHYVSTLNQCFACEQHGHLSSQCPYIHFIPSIEKIAMRRNFAYWQRRDLYHVRNERICYHSRLDQSFIKERGEDYFLHMTTQSPETVFATETTIPSNQNLITEEASPQKQKLSSWLKKAPLRKIQTRIDGSQVADQLFAMKNNDSNPSEYALNQLAQRRKSTRKSIKPMGISAKNNFILESIIKEKIQEMMTPGIQISPRDQSQTIHAGSFNNAFLANTPQQLDTVPENPIQPQTLISPTQQSGSHNSNFHHEEGKSAKKGITKFLRKGNQKSNHQRMKRDSKNILINENTHVLDQQQYLLDLFNVGQDSKNHKRVIFQDKQITEEQPPANHNESDDLDSQNIGTPELNSHENLQHKHQKYSNLRNFLSTNNTSTNFIQSMSHKSSFADPQNPDTHDENEQTPTSSSENSSENDGQQGGQVRSKYVSQTDQRRKSLNKLNNTLKSKISSISTIMKFRNYTKNMNKRLENNLKKKEEELQEVKKLKEQQELNNLLVSVPDDTSIKYFEKYYPRENYNPDLVIKHYEWTKANLIKTPEFGIYTIQERRIQRKNYQPFEYNFDRKIPITLATEQDENKLNGFKFFGGPDPEKLRSSKKLLSINPKQKSPSMQTL